MTIRDIIAKKMGEVGWSQADLSRITGIPRQNLSPMLRGQRPLRVQHLFRIDNALGLNLDYHKFYSAPPASEVKQGQNPVSSAGSEPAVSDPI